MTKYGICKLSLVPIRKHPTEQSEMINQLLFGDTVFIVDTDNEWYLIKTSHDMYEGWIDRKQVCIISETEFLKLGKTNHFLADIYTVVVSDSDSISLLLGSSLPNYKDGSISISNNKYNTSCNFIDNSLEFDIEKLIDIAKKYIGSPYLWGGRSPFGIDCSGFVQIVFGMFGIKLDRDSYKQAETGHTISFINEIKKGDLAFFDNAEGKITHVGILLDNNTIIHSSGKVRIDSIDHQGIYNKEEKKYSHKLRIIKRII